MPRPLTIDVLICTHNRAQLLHRTIKYLNAAERPSETAITLVVAANACTDGTEAALTAYQAQERGQDLLPLHWHSVPTPGKSNALNAVIPKLSAELIAFVDDDHRVDDGYLVAVAKAARDHPNAMLLCGRIYPDWDGREPGWVHDRGPYRIYPLPIPRFDLGERVIDGPTGATPGGGNLVVRREAFARAGEFSPDLGPIGHNLGGAEDIEWVQRARQMGEHLVYVPSIVQHHYVELERLKLGYLMHKAYERTMSTLRLNSTITPDDRLPLYMLRKVLEYGLKALFSLGTDRRRFYLVRFAAALGEVRGFFRRRVEASRGISRGRETK